MHMEGMSIFIAVEYWRHTDLSFSIFCMNEKQALKTGFFGGEGGHRERERVSADLQKLRKKEQTLS